ncbi:hypothetical protein [Staphylococcus muscae]|uniref:Integrase n=1 Tax=Staphylococcus muscae TaxID=1294 RepID=A0ABQ1HJ47_9STAP|nr:hypothetical protein [Staphylococcus muscae]GGA80010.1 hypothetical protein GCM10007183_00190 [Staphylococcus muscae]
MASFEKRGKKWRFKVHYVDEKRIKSTLLKVVLTQKQKQSVLPLKLKTL